jgi:hypothetical protein
MRKTGPEWRIPWFQKRVTRRSGSLASIGPRGTLKFGHHSQKGWDIKVERPGGETLYVQVKTASEFGSGKLSKICPPSSRRARAGEDEVPDYWNRLWLIWLDRQLCPETLWMLLPQHVRFNRAEYLEGKTIRRPNFPTSGSACFRWNQATSVARKDLMAFGEE